MFKLCMIAMIGAAAATCTTTSCTYTDGHTHVFSKMLNDDGTANADHERWHCEKSGTSGCACTCGDALKCTVNHHHTSGYTRSFDHCEAKAADTLEFGMYSFAVHPGGDWNLVDDIAELEDRKNHFIEFYNANDGIPAIKHFTSSNCCWTLRAGKRLYIDGYYSYPHQSDTKCNPSSGYEGKYHFYTSKHSWISTLTTAHTFSEGTNCADNNNPAIYYRGGTISSMKTMTGCVKPSGWVRPYGNVAISAAGAESCKASCKAGGYMYYGLECPMSTTVHCQCHGDSSLGVTYGDEYCEGTGNPLVHAHNHCVGPYIADGYRFGDYTVGSVYLTN